MEFSIIVPTYNRTRQLTDCLAALARLDYARDRFEVVVVDDGGSTPLEEVTAGFRAALDLTLLTSANAGPAAARNLGARRARGAYLAFTDDDCRPAAGWLRALGDRARSTPGAMVGGRTLNALPDNLCSTLSQAVIDVVYAHYNADPDHGHFFTTNNLAVPADRFRTLGGFDAAFTTAEDRDLCERWLSDGGQLVYAPDAIVHHAHALTVVGLWRQHWRYGRGAYRFHRTRALYGRKSFKIEPAFYRDLVLYPYLRDTLPRAVRLTGLLAVQQVANLMGFLAAMLRRT